jgi:hypothetical protein
MNNTESVTIILLVSLELEDLGIIIYHYCTTTPSDPNLKINRDPTYRRRYDDMLFCGQKPFRVFVIPHGDKYLQAAGNCYYYYPREENTRTELLTD